ncbi:MAG: serine/threonine-protein kinase [Fibrobacteria bacterium]
MAAPIPHPKASGLFVAPAVTAAPDAPGEGTPSVNSAAPAPEVIPVSAQEPRSRANPLATRESGRLTVGQVHGKTPKSALPQAGETFANRYRVEKYLGLGALCNSYLCRDTRSGNREVVLKLMHSRKAAEAGLPESFLFLAESVAKYDYKGIARIYDSGRHEGAPWYAMEWVGGVPLRLWLMERLNFENRVLPGLGFIVSLLDTFEIIHARGCYGCLKPENIFITLNGPVVTDFGVVGFLTPQEFEFNSYARRYLPYMAPELRQDWGNLLPNSDFYSIGAILYEILVGRAPGSQLRLPSELSRIFGIEADEIILKSMAVQPLDRFATVEAFKQAVLALQASLLNARPQEEHPAPVANPVAPASIPPRGSLRPQVNPGLEVTSDKQTLHNPEVEFEEPGSRDMLIGGPASYPDAQGQSDSPWIREEPAIRAGAEAAEARLADSEDASSRTIFYPTPDDAGGDKSPASFGQLGDRIVEEAHVQRRFAHSPSPFAGTGGEGGTRAVDNLRAWESLSGQPDSMAEVIREEEESEPVPAWLWVFIALAGSCLVVLSAYLGLLHGN